MQVPLLVVAALIVFDGLVGPQLAPKNLATVSVWLHYRGWVVLALLVAGNLFCMACPFMLPRQAARWLRERRGGGRNVPARLRNKWLAVGGVIVFLFCYENFSLWASPWWTAWIVLGYFAVAFAVDTIFRGAAFCKHVCPLGQFNFFGSLISPLEIKVREPAVCESCRTKDCITAGVKERSGGEASAGLTVHDRNRLTPALAPERSAGASESRFRNTKTSITKQAIGARPGARGCELALFQPRKAGNMDCTFCLDCVHACPYDNVGLIARTPTAELWTDPFRSGIGRFSQRTDLAALVLLFAFGSFLNAFAMIRPVYGVQAALARWLGTTSRAPGLALIFALGLGALPIAVLTAAAAASRVFGGLSHEPLWTVMRRYIYSLAPLGFGMWLAHYAFHFLTGGLTIVPVMQSFLADIGLYAGAPAWGLGPLVPAGWLFPIEALLLYLGAFGSLIVAFQISSHVAGDTSGNENAAIRVHPRSSASHFRVSSHVAGDTSGDENAAIRVHTRSSASHFRVSVQAPAGTQSRSKVLGAAAPWMLVCLLLLGFGLWIMLQPMEMRGTLLMTPAPGG